MKDLSKLKMVLDLARDFESKKTDNKLEEGVRKTTKILLEAKPNTTYEDLVTNLLLSTRESYKHMINSDEIESTMEVFTSLVDAMFEDEEGELEENEEVMLKYILRYYLVTNMLKKSFNVSIKAITEAWNGTRGTA